MKSGHFALLMLGMVLVVSIVYVVAQGQRPEPVQPPVAYHVADDCCDMAKGETSEHVKRYRNVQKSAHTIPVQRAGVKLRLLTPTEQHMLEHEQAEAANEAAKTQTWCGGAYDRDRGTNFAPCREYKRLGQVESPGDAPAGDSAAAPGAAAAAPGPGGGSPGGPGPGSCK
jgi:hypothetical protein